jgi:hypothetical protein
VKEREYAHGAVNQDQLPYYHKIPANTVFTSQEYDWRELIYQMAKDYSVNNYRSDFSQKLA